ncbi:MAG: putative lipid II flippase FtsW [bacterium]
MIKEKLHRPDIFLLVITVLLVIIGIIMIYSASAIMALERYNNTMAFLQKELVWALLGMIGLLAMLKFDYHKLQKLSRVLLIISAILLMVVLTGLFAEAKGAHRWIRVGPIGVQPSEIAKICLIIYLADIIDRKQSKIKSFNKGIIPAVAVLGVICLLILKEPDLGTPILLTAIGCLMLLIGGARIWHILSLFVVALPVIVFAIVRTPYRLQRMMTFLNPGEDPQGKGYQITQSLLALGSGGLNGVGLGNGTQKLLYLPEPHTDFIFPIIGEELGFIGTALVVVLFGLFVWRAAKIAVHAPDLFGNLLAGGLTFVIGLQALINIGVVTAALPTKGLPLPFLSFGGSSLVCTMMGVGILLNISKHIK